MNDVNIELGKRISQLRKKKGLSMQEVADRVGVASSTIQRYETGKVNKIKLPVVESIAKALNTTAAYLIGKTDNDSPHTTLVGFVAEDNNLLNASAHIKNLEADIVHYRQGFRLPILGVIQAGAPILAVENIEGYDFADVPNDKEYFFLRVRGDSMVNAHIYDGDLVLIRIQSTAEDGNIVACIINGDEATLKRFYRRGDTIILQPENSAYPPIIVSAKDFDNGYARIIGVAKEVKRKL